jgi:hypothetical protein
MLTGPEGFVASPDLRSLVIEAKPVRGDGLEEALVTGADIGILGIELSTRRRNRVNGRIVDNCSGAGFFVGRGGGGDDSGADFEAYPVTQM